MEGQKGREDVEENVNSYWMILRKWEDTGIWNWKPLIENCGELALEEMWTLSKQYKQWMNIDFNFSV